MKKEKYAIFYYRKIKKKCWILEYLQGMKNLPRVAMERNFNVEY